MQQVIRRNRDRDLIHDGLAIFTVGPNRYDFAQFDAGEIANAEPTEEGKFIVYDGRTPYLLTKRNLDAATRHLARHPG